MKRLRAIDGGEGGFTLAEVLITLAIFSILTAGIYSAYTSQLTHFTREYGLAHSEIDLMVARNLVERDFAMAGFGLPDNFNGVTSEVPPVKGINGTVTDPDAPDELQLFGTAVGIQNRASQGWMYMDGSLTPISDGRESVQDGDWVIVINASGEDLQKTSGGEWLFQYRDGYSSTLRGKDGSSLDVENWYLLYGLHTDGTKVTKPYNTVRYFLDTNTSPSFCAPETKSLMRFEAANPDASPSPPSEAIFSCVRDFQVRFQVDPDGDGVYSWGEADVMSTWTAKQVRQGLKRIRADVLVQVGSRDRDYIHPSNVTVGSRVVNLTSEQTHYRWRVVSFDVTPRNLQ